MICLLCKKSEESTNKFKIEYCKDCVYKQHFRVLEWLLKNRILPYGIIGEVFNIPIALLNEIGRKYNWIKEE